MRADTPIQPIDFSRTCLYNFRLTESPQTLFNYSVLFVFVGSLGIFYF